MNLESLTMTDLAVLRDHLSAAAEAGDILAEAGLIPTFAISDTRPLLTVPPIGAMPVRAVQASVGALALTPRRNGLVKDGPRERPTESEPATEAAPPAAVPTADDAPAVQDEPAPTENAPRPAPKQVAPENTAPRYTPVEMHKAVTMLCDMVEAGSGKMTAYEAIGAALDRSPESVAMKFRSPDWARAYSDEAARRAALSSPPAPVAPPAPARSIYEDPLVQRITGLKMPPQWDHAADRRLLVLAAKGLDAATIAVNLEVAPKIVTGRLAQLTNGGMHPAAELLTAVEAILGEQRKGVAA